MATPTEKALRLIATELKGVRKELITSRRTIGVLSARVDELGGHVKGLQIALSEREHDLAAQHEELGQRAQTTHDRVTAIDARVTRAERALKLRPA